MGVYACWPDMCAPLASWYVKISCLSCCWDKCFDNKKVKSSANLTIILWTSLGLVNQLKKIINEWTYLVYLFLRFWLIQEHQEKPAGLRVQDLWSEIFQELGPEICTMMLLRSEKVPLNNAPKIWILNCSVR